MRGLCYAMFVLGFGLLFIDFVGLNILVWFGFRRFVFEFIVWSLVSSFAMISCGWVLRVVVELVCHRLSVCCFRYVLIWLLRFCFGWI